MSELPRTDDPPHVDARYDQARVEEAFGAFAERVRELESVANELRTELRTLRAERPIRAPRHEDERWPVEPGPNLSPDWVAAVPAPLPRVLTVPRVALESAFLLLVALFAGLADLSATWIVLVMVAAWALVVLFEWAAAAKRARWHLDEIAAPLAADAADTTGPWDMPVVEATVVEAAADPESKTIITSLPAEDPDNEPADSADTAEEPAAPKRRRFRRRKQPAEASGADPWEA